MSDVLIKGMKMPNCCAECALNLEAECYPCNRLVCDKPYESRADWCPLIEVPPHGRLIDADAIKFKYGIYDEYYEKIKMVSESDIEDMPTIIGVEAYE